LCCVESGAAEAELSLLEREAAARPTKRVRSAVGNYILMGWVREGELRLVAQVVLGDGYCWMEERKSASYPKFPLKVVEALPGRKR
jgi:hypothetical protein